MQTINIVLESLMNQTIKPNRYQLWLADDQFPDKRFVDEQLNSFLERGLEIHYCDDIKSHKKYYYAMKNNPEAIVITDDDDIIYPENMLETLLAKYREYPECVVAQRAHLMLKSGEILEPYNKWSSRAPGCAGPDLYLCATGCSGCLYPSHTLSEHVFEKDVFMKICYYADDIWLKCMEYLVKTPVVLTGINNPEIFTIAGTSEGGLAQTNVEDGKNDQQLMAVTEHYDIKWD